MADAEQNICDLLEFQSVADDYAWYAVTIRYGKRDGDSYFDIHYKHVLPIPLVNIIDLKDSNEVETTIRRLRLLSRQLKDEECRDVKEGMPVCAAQRSNESEEPAYFYFDAVVKKVHRSPHEKKEGRACSCTFEVVWIIGPSEGESSTVTLKDICLLTQESIEYDPVIQFLQRALEENKKRSEETVVVTTSNATNSDDNEPDRSVESEANVGSSHSCPNAFLPPEAASPSLSGTCITNFQDNDIPDNNNIF